jgi:hypothetical protein
MERESSQKPDYGASGLSGNVSDISVRCSVQMSVLIPTALTEMLRGFTQDKERCRTLN